MSDWTPGPWRVYKSATQGYTYIHSGKPGMTIAKMIDGREYMDDDARLIAASPEMAELLGEIDNTVYVTFGQRRRIRGILAKISGEDAHPMSGYLTEEERRIAGLPSAEIDGEGDSDARRRR